MYPTLQTKQQSEVEKHQQRYSRKKQARYRKNQSGHMMNLEKENEQEIERLKRRRLSTAVAFLHGKTCGVQLSSTFVSFDTAYKNQS
ncbi:hypothetical protein JG687_00011222 [Phytophthora cactorum]|uniref:Uncharacterized protein n=1 Tax=Phytophthora cactorum TaxID=29920 RepID=A0A329SBN2_9STRA|nr:hypothetical protein Pcac1_g15710 [Phytophthora cactorum]KAG2890924.1 hypothetical protein PC114_g17228 [Phytophthora cactorum]KAG2934305.1 hypothetical protein PC117_g12690 [Phytophthora cactorum]KAG2976947.1 hypothetical protein PC118_g13160 [Phytophthora cactorum]KAG2992692.1 hypothetical protein PC119_g18619 [Phytophthora cactorum]